MAEGQIRIVRSLSLPGVKISSIFLSYLHTFDQSLVDLILQANRKTFIWTKSEIVHREMFGVEIHQCIRNQKTKSVIFQK